MFTYIKMELTEKRNIMINKIDEYCRSCGSKNNIYKTEKHPNNRNINSEHNIYCFDCMKTWDDTYNQPKDFVGEILGEDKMDFI